MQISDPKDILHINYNQDQSCFVVATSKGYSVFNISPFKETFCRILEKGV